MRKIRRSRRNSPGTMPFPVFNRLLGVEIIVAQVNNRERMKNPLGGVIVLPPNVAAMESTIWRVPDFPMTFLAYLMNRHGRSRPPTHHFKKREKIKETRE